MLQNQIIYRLHVNSPGVYTRWAVSVIFFWKFTCKIGEGFLPFWLDQCCLNGLKPPTSNIWFQKICTANEGLSCTNLASNQTPLSKKARIRGGDSVKRLCWEGRNDSSIFVWHISYFFTSFIILKHVFFVKSIISVPVFPWNFDFILSFFLGRNKKSNKTHFSRTPFQNPSIWYISIATSWR